MVDDKIICPKCHSDQLHVGKRGFKVGRAAIATALTGKYLYGMIAGGTGQNDIIITCLRCGNQFRPGQALTKGDLKPFVMPDGVKFVGSENTALYWCPCGRHTSLPTSNPTCPKCGRRLNDSYKPTKEQAEAEFKANKGGCLGIFILPPFIAIALAMLF